MNGLKVMYNLHEYSGDKVYISFAIGMGVSVRRYCLDGKQEFLSNLAFANMWSNYIKKLYGLDYKCVVDRTNTYVVKQTNQKNMAVAMEEFLKMVFATTYDAEIFEQVKIKTMDNFKSVYKNGRFRGVHKSYEATEWNKEFYLKRLIDDIQGITYEQFVDIAKILLVPSNCQVFVNGSVRELSDEEIDIMKQAIPEDKPKVTMLANIQEPYLRKDMHVIEVAEEPCNINAVCLSFDTKVNMMTRYYYAVIEGSKIKERDKYMHVDFMDASYIVISEELRSMKRVFQSLVTKEQYEEAQLQEKIRITEWLENEPIMFATKVLEIQMLGISLTEYLQLLNQFSYEDYIGVMKECRPVVCEAQVVMRR